MWATMRSPTRSSSGGSAWGYGLGLRLFSGGSWGHTGSIESIKALMIGLPDGGSVAVLIDGDRPERTDDLIEIVAEVRRDADAVSAAFGNASCFAIFREICN